MRKQNKSMIGAFVLSAVASAGLAPSATANQCAPYSISAAPAEAAEGTYMYFRVFRSGDPTGTATVAYSTVGATATSNVDFRPSSGSLTFRPNEVLKTVPVWINWDDDSEVPETVQLLLTGAGTQPPATNGLGLIVSAVSPTVPGVPSVPTIPRLPGVPTVPGIPGGVPGVPTVPGIPGGVPGVPTVPGIPGGVPGVPTVPGIPGAPGVPPIGLPTVPPTPGIPTPTPPRPPNPCGGSPYCQ